MAVGFIWIMWGLALILKEAYKVSPLWMIGSMLMPVVMAFFVIKFPEQAYAPRMKMLKGVIPFFVGLGLLFASASPEKEALAKPVETSAAAPAPAPVLAPHPLP